ncbi:helix-turn-helix domain-containing protein [Agarivorans sp. B2Z047]|uniref:helix-turn-helix domain-containing protein n=1 Tax=Agarivorans sp. B2Z047 TaxID=2652721 RepID=UPI00128C7BC0|nr:transcriptional regulator [Agarivorans sp. B2Z047]MPW31921.1 helix-turn-helix domain-containing protein [Agarivorans sp. B2Z047]UQN44855.1 transcriptional regulator [Agarivorans sp. B2Z047]
MSAIGERLKSLRINRKLSQKELGDLTGTSQQTIQRIEAGIILKPRDTVRIAKALGVSPYFLELGHEEAKTEIEQLIEPLKLSEQTKSIITKLAKLDNTKKIAELAAISAFINKIA